MSIKSIFNKIQTKKKMKDVIIIVSGLPRSGTSMMMQMLEAGGIPIVTDNIRKPDTDNPRGYYEFEKVKKIKEDVSWLEDCYGKVFKMVSMLLYELPNDKKYKIVFMKREMKEMLASQRAMLQRLKQESPDVSDDEMAQKFEKHLREIEKWLKKQNNIEVIYVKYNDVIENPYQNAKKINQFMGGWMNVEKMAGVVEKSLYRQRKRG